MRICVLGDSIPWGSRDLEEGGWVDRFKVYFMNTGQFNEVFNLCNPGEVSGELLKRIENEIPIRVKPQYRKNNVVIIQIGANDPQSLTDKNIIRTPLEEFRENVKKIIEISNKFAETIVVVGLTPLDEDRTDPIPWNTDVSYRNENAKKYNDVIKSVCTDNNIYFIELFDNWINSDYKKLLHDGLHPNAEGHKKIFEIVKAFLIKNKVI